MTLNEDPFMKQVMNADRLFQTEREFHEVMPPLLENWLDPKAQQEAAAFLTSEQLRDANRAAEELKNARMENKR